MTRPQHEATRALIAAEYAWLESYGWKRVYPGSKVRHPKAPDTKPDYSVSDAMILTKANPLKYST